jgi:hypothetical protein
VRPLRKFLLKNFVILTEGERENTFAEITDGTVAATGTEF